MSENQNEEAAGALGGVVGTGAGVGGVVATVSAVGTVPGLSAAGITSGLAAMGFGSMMTGIIIATGGVAMLGIGCAVGARHLYRRYR
jgi:hypothetical protein